MNTKPQKKTNKPNGNTEPVTPDDDNLECSE